MTCRYTFNGKTYEAHEFDDLLRAMPPIEASKYMPTVRALPAAPFVDKTSAWVTLALKKVVHIAATSGYDKVAFVNGDQSAERYDLSKQVRSIAWTGRGNDTEKRVTITPNSGNDIEFRVLPDGTTASSSGGLAGNEFASKRLDEVVGKDVAERIMGTPYGDMRGNGLKVGGEGMKAFYDKIVPTAANKLLAKLGGGRVETVQIGITDDSRYTVTRATVSGRDEWRVWDEQNDDALISTHATEAEAKTRANELNLKSNGAISGQQPGFTITPEMREKASAGLPLFRKGADQTTGLTPTQFTQALSEAFGAKVADRLQAKGVVVPLADQTKLPAHVVPFLRDGDIVFGFYDPRTNRTYAVLENLTPDMVKGLAMHEVGVHYGFEAMLGADKYKQVMKQLDLMRKSGNVAVQAAYDQAKANAARPSQVPEETLAYLVQNSPENSVIKDVIARIKAWLFREFGIGGKYLTERDLHMLAKAAVQHAARTEPGGVEVPAFMRGPEFSRAPATDTKAFKDWFGDSKVVDAEGKPLVVYHGTKADFDVFKRTSGGEFGPAIYLTDNPREAGEYGDGKGWGGPNGTRIMPLYVSIKNPYTKGVDAFWKEFGGADSDAAALDRAQAAGYDGIIAKRPDRYYDNEAREFVDRGGELTHYIAFRPEQIKSATGNNGNFDPKDPDIRFSRTNAAQEPEWWQEPGESKLDKLIYEIQDGRIDLKRVQEAIKATGKDIAERFDARMAETLYPGRVARRTDVFLNTEVRPLLQAMALSKIGMDELGDYLIARHAPERNAQVAKVNPDLPDGGAGRNSQGELMTDDAAAAYLAALSPEKAKQLAALARRVDSITAGTRELLVGEGLEKPETVKAWTSAYKNYVPLFKDEAEHGHPIGTGFNVGGSASKRSTGSTKEVTNVLAHVLMQREAVITRAEKNRVGLALYGLALSHPNKNFWTVVKPGMSNTEIAAELQAMGVDPMMLGESMDAAPTIRTVDTATNQVVDRPNPMYKKMDGAITLKVAGEDRVLLFNEKDERALRLATNLKNMDGATAIDWSTGVLHEYVSKSIPKWVGVAPATRWLASVNTQYNPVFGLVNVTRDVMGGVVNLTNTPLRKRKMQVLGDVLPALKGISRDLRGGARNEWSDLFNQFQDDGGQTGFKEMFRTADDRARAIEKELQAAEGKLTVGKATHAVLDLLDDFNTALENAVRLSAYKAGLDEGMSRPAAAKLARELTVDFNRKGRTGRELGPLYAFLNASIQGTARTVQTLAGPAGAKIVAGGLAIGGLQALMLAFAGFDEDEPPEWVKTRGLIIPIGGDKRYIVIPLALGLHVIPNTGRVLTELALYGGNDAFDRMGRAIGEIAGAFNPLGGGNIFTMDGALRTVMPTVIDPFIELGFNKNFAGSEIEKRPFNEEGDNRPGFQRARESTLRSTTGQAYLGISKAINTLTGGNDFEAGAASPTPERIRYLAQTVGGGLLREMEKAVNATTKAGQGDDIASREIPMAGRFVGQIDPDMAERARYFESSNKIKKYASSLTAAEKAGADEIAGKISKKYPEVELANTLRSAQERIRKLNKNAAETINDRDELARIDRDRFDEMKALNAEIKAMERLTRGPTLAEKIRGEDGR